MEHSSASCDCCDRKTMNAQIRETLIACENEVIDGARKVGGELKLPFAVYVPPAKDVREFVRLGGTRAMIENTLKGLIWQNG